eukprot:CAMPEP_0172511030 /NCGR_PEP_ID=MMETSP1066-20121228/233156_1 /TAXON_ID=671091 /ORGANISM="Coscinodiscus wailesii, Strain CCMP2513" /LENGTH=32 /DNA_ID= /DNA_START= /DNA_END= /DNA_ORIENTATION=
MTYDEALKLYRLEKGEEAELPVLESDDDVWKR